MNTRDEPRREAKRKSDTCLIFIHIPKTAGQSLHFALLRRIREEEKIHLNVLGKSLGEEMQRVPLKERTKAQVLWGHVPFGVHEHIPRECQYITVVRHPVDRVVSVYKHILRYPSHQLHDLIVGSSLGLEDYVTSGVDVSQTRNSQVRQLSGRQLAPIDRTTLDEAKRNLETFLAVGITELFEESLVLLRRALRVRLSPYVTRNVSQPLDVSEQSRALIEQYNDLDLELYAFARELFDDHVARQSSSFAWEVAAYKAMRPLARASGRAADVIRGRPRVGRETNS